MQNPIAYLDWKLEIVCPSCLGDFNLADYDANYDMDISRNIFHNTWEMLRGYPIQCPHCSADFEIGKVIY